MQNDPVKATPICFSSKDNGSSSFKNFYEKWSIKCCLYKIFQVLSRRGGGVFPRKSGAMECRDAKPARRLKIDSARRRCDINDKSGTVHVFQNIIMDKLRRNRIENKAERFHMICKRAQGQTFIGDEKRLCQFIYVVGENPIRLQTVLLKRTRWSVRIFRSRERHIGFYADGTDCEEWLRRLRLLLLQCC